MEDLLIEILSSFNEPVRLQGSLLSDEPYPDSFFTFWNDESNGDSFIAMRKMLLFGVIALITTLLTQLK